VKNVVQEVAALVGGDQHLLRAEQALLDPVVPNRWRRELN